MAQGDVPITLVGNLTADPELRFTPSGAGVASFTVASTTRRKNPQTDEWEDGDSVFLRCSVWRQQAENLCESATKGMRVVVVGRLKQRSYETKEGEKRTVFEVEADDVGVSVKSATAKVTKVAREGGQGWGQANGSQAAASSGSDPWATPATASAVPGSASYADEPPF